jgi:Tol biopolymer transport system component
VKMKNIWAVLVLLIVAVVSPVSAQNPSHFKWREYETEHYKIFYPEGQEFTAYQTAEIAEKVHEPLITMYGPTDSKVSIVIKDNEDYANGGAYFYDNKVEISATSLDYEFRSYNDWLWNVITHELTHIYSLKQSMKAPRWIPMIYYQHIDYQEEKREDVLVGYPNILASYPVPMFNVPGWLAEGIAQYNARGAKYDRWDGHRDMIIRQAVLNDKMLSINDMQVFNWTGRGNEMVYNHGYSLILFIGEKFGDEKISELIKSLSSPTAITFDIACRNILDMDKDQLYDLWISSLKERYETVKESLGDLIEGTTFRKGGFINSYPVWSPDGSKLAYVSNRGQDYGIRSCRIANFEPGGWQWKGKEKDIAKHKKKLEKQIKKSKDQKEIEDTAATAAGAFDIALGGNIQSAPVWLDEYNILYNRRMPSDKHGSHWWDMYRYVINRKDSREGTEKRITHNLRGIYPHLSPDKSKLVFVKNYSGLNNLFVMNRDDNSIEQLTFFTDGTRMYKPQWSPDGNTIIFTIHRKSSVDIAMINRDGSDLKNVVSSDGQDRDPVWTSDGKSIVFSSDISGIPNLYRMEIENGSFYQVTNVIGAAFQPAISPGDTTLAFSYYGPDGYEIRLMPFNEERPVADSNRFRKKTEQVHNTPQQPYPVSESKPYMMQSLDFSYMPVVRNDRGNMKFGSYMMKSEVINQGDFLFSGAISPANSDTDLFAMFLYRKFVPTVFIEMYRQTRSVSKRENYMEEYGTIIRKRTFDLNEIDFGLQYNYRDKHEFEGRLIYSQYNAKVEYTHFLTGPKVHKPAYTYSRGFDLAAIYRYDTHIRARDEDINPRGGRKVHIRYDHNIDFFLDGFENVGFLREKYKRYPYNRYFINWIERIPLAWTKKHTLLLRGQANIIDRKVDYFYESQMGGTDQMRGYTFYSLSGRKNVMGQVLYRFPIFYDMRKSFSVWYLNHIYMGVFADIGKAWNKKSLNWSSSGFKHDAGIELRLDSISFYNFPTMIEFSAAYGPDDIWIKHFDEENSKTVIIKDDQEPWKFYFNILFGFN